MTLWILLAILFPSLADAACTGSSPTWTSTVDQASVSSCVSSATSGDTINISAGADTWTGQVSIPAGKTLTIVGAGVGSTIITSAQVYVFNINSDNTRITAIEFNCSKVRASQAVDWRVDHNKFTCSTHTDGMYVQGSGTGPATPRGLIDHNDFVDMRVLITPHALTSVAALQNTSHWTRGPEFGAVDGVYVEDNTFFETTGNALDCNYSARYVARYNTITDGYIEAHSVQATHRACRGGEIYRNTINDAAGGATPSFIMFIRGGSWMIFSNTATGTFGSSLFRLNNIRSCRSVSVDATRADGTSGWDENTSPIATYRGWLARDQIGAGADVAAWGAADTNPPAQGKSPLYAWLNTHNGSNLAPNVAAGEACDGALDYHSTHIVENRDYYTYQASFDGTVGVGSGTLASRPSTCTTGVGYWATDQGNWNKIPGGSQGVLYKCAATNTWTLYYTPYTYPHPLQGYVTATNSSAASGSVRFTGNARMQ